MSQFDGHDNYTKEFELERAQSEATGFSLLRALESGLALFVGFTVAYQVLEAYRSAGLHGSQDRLECAIVMFFSWWIAAAIFLGIVHVNRYRSRARLKIDGAAFLAVMLLFLLPVSNDHFRLRKNPSELRQREIVKTERDPVAEQRRAVAEEERRASAARRLPDEVRGIGSHGPAGEVPPMLEVKDLPDGRSVSVTSLPRKSYQGIEIALARVKENKAIEGGWQGCTMLTKVYKYGKEEDWQYIRAGQTAVFYLQESCAAELSDGALEFRVREVPDGGWWWSDSAFAYPAGFSSNYHLAPRGVR